MIRPNLQAALLDSTKQLHISTNAWLNVNTHQDFGNPLLND
jgi:hypothetical protein